MQLPRWLLSSLEAALGAQPEVTERVGGGDISPAARLVVGSDRFFVKWSERRPRPEGWPRMFEAEAMGLIRLAETQTVRVPSVVACGSSIEGQGEYLVLEWIEVERAGHRTPAAALLGHSLARLHRCSAETFGLDHHNYCGSTPQPNTVRMSWTEFFGKQRLGWLLRSADAQGLLPPERARRLLWLIANLPRWIDEDEIRPALIHGDLWGGNWLVEQSGEPVLIDPAIYYADPEMELAMCQLFGGFPPEFYAAYDEAFPPRTGRAQRRTLYQLYHLLNHLILFGEGYGGSVDAILGRFTA